MDQILINGIILGFIAVLSFLLKVIWDGLRDLQEEDRSLKSKIGAVELQMSDRYIKKVDFDKLTTDIFTLLRRIEDKLDNKADKP
jgi:hypothetical protein